MRRGERLWTVLEIGSTQVPIVLVPPSHLAEENGGPILGDYNPTLNRIRVRNDSPEQLAASTAFHEIGHASLFQAGFAGWHDERIITPVTAAMFDCLHRNGLFRMPMIPPGRRGRRTP